MTKKNCYKIYIYIRVVLILGKKLKIRNFKLSWAKLVPIGLKTVQLKFKQKEIIFRGGTEPPKLRN